MRSPPSAVAWWPSAAAVAVASGSESLRGGLTACSRPTPSGDNARGMGKHAAENRLGRGVEWECIMAGREAGREAHR